MSGHPRYSVLRWRVILVVVDPSQVPSQVTCLETSRGASDIGINVPCFFIGGGNINAVKLT